MNRGKKPPNHWENLFKDVQWGGDLKIGIRSVRGLVGVGRSNMLYAKVWADPR